MPISFCPHCKHALLDQAPRLREALLYAVRRNGKPVTAQAFAARSSVSIQQASNALRSLFDTGLLIRSASVSLVRGGTEYEYRISKFGAIEAALTTVLKEGGERDV